MTCRRTSSRPVHRPPPTIRFLTGYCLLQGRSQVFVTKPCSCLHSLQATLSFPHFAFIQHIQKFTVIPKQRVSRLYSRVSRFGTITAPSSAFSLQSSSLFLHLWHSCHQPTNIRSSRLTLSKSQTPTVPGHHHAAQWHRSIATPTTPLLATTDNVQRRAQDPATAAAPP